MLFDSRYWYFMLTLYSVSSPLDKSCSNVSVGKI